MTPRTRAIAARRARILGAIEKLNAHVGPPSTIRICRALGASRYTEGYQIYNDLHALKRKGLVTCIRKPEYREVFWKPRGELTDAEANKIVDAMERADA